MLQLRALLLISLLTVLFCCVNSYRPPIIAILEYETPIIGILTQKVSDYTASKYPNQEFSSYIAASYVKFVEGAGARAVPIWTGKSPSYYSHIIRKVNGVIFPGGGTSMYETGGYGDAGKYIYWAAIELNREGTYFPIWGTCLGFELLIYLAANQTRLRHHCDAEKLALPLLFEEGYEESKMFGNAPLDVLTTLRNDPSTSHFHSYCVKKTTYENPKINRNWKLLGTSYSNDNIEFISAIEHRRYPFYGVQFHPEKNIYEFVERLKPYIPHSSKYTRASQYFANFFVDEARKNSNRFPNSIKEKNSLIYNYYPKYTGVKGSSFVQQYLFTSEDESKD